MKTVGALVALLAFTALAVPTASAQAFDEVTFSFPDTPTEIAYMGTATITGSLTVGCIAGLQDASAEIGAQDVPAWLTVAVDAVDVTPSSACLSPSGSITKDVPVTLTVAKDAPGVVDQTLKLIASVNGETVEGVLEFNVSYYAEYDVVPDVQFPLKVVGPSVTFNLTVTQKSNARSMVMMEEKSETAGSLSGLASVVYEDDARTKVFPITYKAPSGAWTNATVSFKTYGHYLLLEGGAGDFTAGKHIEWTFTNGGSSPKDLVEGNDEPKDSPAPAAPLLGLGLLAFAAFARRR